MRSAATTCLLYTSLLVVVTALVVVLARGRYKMCIRDSPWVLRVRGVRIAFEPRKFMVRAGGCSLSGRSLYPPGGGMPGYRDRQRGEQIRHTCDGRLNTKGLIPSISGGSTGP